MSEEPIVKIFYHRLQGDFGSGNIQGYLVIHPQMFNIGTPGRTYINCTTTRLPGYSSELDSAPEDDYPSFLLAKDWDFEKAKNKDYEYLLSPRKPGNIHVATRGKGLAIAVGHHCTTIDFSPESHFVKMSLEDYKAITSSPSVPGPSETKSHAEKMRSICLPEKFKDPASRSSTEDRTVNIFLAVVCEAFVYAVVDFSRLVKFHVTSRELSWTAADMNPGSEAWPCIWLDKYGPDWNLERVQAIAGAYKWREEILREDMSEAVATQAIVEAMSSDDWVWSGYGEHTACDVLHLAGLHPLMPVRKLCEDSALFDHLISVVQKHTAQWTSADFLRLCAAQPNSSNPFSFHYNSDEHYIARYVKVYHRIEAKVDAQLYETLQKLGLLDPGHTIGETYSVSVPPMSGRYCFLPVYHVQGHQATAYTVIRAQPPEEWGLKPFTCTMVDKDIRQEGPKPTIGGASFREYISNKVDLSAEIKGNPGRRAVEHTGKRGRPRKKPTVAQLRKLAQRFKEPKNKTAPDNIVDTHVVEEPLQGGEDALPVKPCLETRGKGKRKSLVEPDVTNDEDVEQNLQVKRTRLG